MPNIKVAYQYAKEFPNGPFIADGYRIIASFHMDLFGVVRRLREGKEKDFLYDCYKPYVERRPYSGRATKWHDCSGSQSSELLS